MGWSTGDLVSDPAGRWVLENVSEAYSHAGFVYCEGWGGVLIACGGDDAITVGVYSDDDALYGGEEPLAFRVWSDVSFKGDAVAFVREWLGWDFSDSV